jgi:hypothetical protein
MRFFRYRRPSWKTALGITAALRPWRWFGNQQRRLKRRVGYESEPARMFRHGLRRPGGCLLVILAWAGTAVGTGLGGWFSVSVSPAQAGGTPVRLSPPVIPAGAGMTAAGDVQRKSPGAGRDGCRPVRR